MQIASIFVAATLVVASYWLLLNDQGWYGIITATGAVICAVIYLWIGHQQRVEIEDLIRAARRISVAYLESDEEEQDYGIMIGGIGAKWRKEE